MSDTAAELVVDARATLGEGPVWDARRGVLWWVDILNGLVHGYEPASGANRTIEVGQTVGAVAIRRDGGLLVLGQDAILALDPESGRLEVAFVFERSNPPLRCNDAKCDPQGRLWIGRMEFGHPDGTGSLHRLDADLRLIPVLAGLTIPNGMGWSADGRTMYFIDSPTGRVTAFDFDSETGSLGESRVVYRHEGAGGPDGMTVDSEGCLWIGIYGGSRVVRVAPDGSRLGAYELPAGKVTSCAFGGPDLADLYVTTAREFFTAEDDAREPTAGGLFRLRPGVSGLPPDGFRG